LASIAAELFVLNANFLGEIKTPLEQFLQTMAFH